MKSFVSCSFAAVALAAGALFAASPAVAQQERWSQVQLRAPSAEERAIVSSVYGAFLRGAPDTGIEIARVDVNGDRVAEILVRMTHPRLCGQTGCHTALLMHERQGGRQAWNPIMERRSTLIETGAMSQGRPAALRIRVNGREIWELGPNGMYAAVADSFGTDVDLRSGAPMPVLRAAAQAANRALGGGNEIRPDTILAAQVSLGGTQVWIAQVSSGLLCGRVGCPHYIVSAEGQPRILGEFGALEGGLAVGRWPDGAGLIAAQSPEGVSLYAFANGRLTLRETTFASDVTPAP